MNDTETHAPDVAPAEVEIAAAPTGQPVDRLRGRVLESGAPAQAAAPAARRRPSGYLISFLACVAAPSLVFTLYFLLIASDQFVAETRFAVHSQAMDAVSSSAKMSKPTTTASIMGGLTASTDDSYMVAAYIRSRACIDDVSRTLNLREMFRRPEADVWARLRADASPEELTKYWNAMVSSYVDPPSGIVTVSVAAFRREDALAIAKAILASAEEVANAVSAKARADVLATADREVASAQARVTDSLADLRAFREKAGFVDPRMQAESLNKLLDELIAKRLQLQTEYEVSAKAMSPAAPTLQGVRSRLDQLDAEIVAERAKLTSHSADPQALANMLPAYETLLVRSTFAERLYTLAADGLERARLRAEAQTIYVNVFVPPALPQDYEFPNRFASPALLALAAFILWGIGALTAALVEDHKL